MQGSNSLALAARERNTDDFRERYLPELPVPVPELLDPELPDPELPLPVLPVPGPRLLEPSGLTPPRSLGLPSFGSIVVLLDGGVDLPLPTDPAPELPLPEDGLEVPLPTEPAPELPLVELPVVPDAAPPVRGLP